MLYFILWVIFLVVVILAIPVTSMLEKRQYHAAQGKHSRDEVGGDEAFDDEMSVESSESEMVSDDFDGQDEVADFADATPAGGDDFAAFEDEFK